MPGIFGCYGNMDDDLADEMSSLLTHDDDWFEGKCFCYHFHGVHGFHGVVDFKSQVESNYASLNNMSIVTYGDIYLSEGKISNADEILSLYERYGNTCLNSLNGSFALSIYDNGKLIIANDRLSSRNIFYSMNLGKVIYSSEIKAILADWSIKPILNREAVVELFTFSYPLGNKTFFREIELLPPSSSFTYHQDISKIEKYWDVKFTKTHQNNLNSLIEQFGTIMEKAVEIRMSDKDKIGIFLSGGVDSRLIAGFAKRIADKSGNELVSFTFGTKGGWQEKIAKQVANELGIKNIFYEIPTDMIANYAEEVVYKGDGAIRIRNAHFIPAFDKVRNEVDTVLVGAFCDTIFGSHLSHDVSNITTKTQLTDHIFKLNKIESIAEYIPKIFEDTFLNKPAKVVTKSFQGTVNEIPLSSYANMVQYWDLRQRARRYIFPLSITRTGWYLNARDPFLDNNIVDFAINIPLELKMGKKIIHESLKYIFPYLAKIPDEHTGAPADAGSIMNKFCTAKRLAVAKPKIVIERLSGGKISFCSKDYRAYDYWLRTGSRSFVEEILSNVDNDIFNSAYVSKILKEHASCQKNHDQLICDILNIQLLLNIYGL